MIDSAKIKEFTHRSKYLATKFGFAEEAEDVSQAVLLKFVEKGKGQSVEQAVIDWARKNGKEDRKGRLRFPLAPPIDDRIDDSQPQGIQLKNFDAYLKRLDRQDRAIAVLRYVWGFDIDEISYCFGFNRSLVSIRMGIIHKKIKGYIKYATT